MSMPEPYGPILRVELDHLKHAVVVAIGRHSQEIQRLAEEACVKMLTPEHITHLVQQHVAQVMELRVYEAADRAIRYAIEAEIRDKVQIAAADGARAACATITRRVKARERKPGKRAR
jgi:hypothetical protein